MAVKHLQPATGNAAKTVRSNSLAVVGCGPRGLYCLDRLTQELRRSGLEKRLEVTIIEPAASPGAGNVYAVDQPAYLRMNFAARYIDAWAKDGQRGAGQLSLVDWLREHHPAHAGPDRFVPRALVGEYLHACYQTTLSALKELADVRVIAGRVRDISRQAGMWRLVLEDGDLLTREVLLTTGHEGWRPALAPRTPESNVIHRVFPVATQLSHDNIPAGQTVAVQGFGLTWIDATLSLTEGRGGTFHGDATATRYIRSGEEPRVILPFSRSGRPMFAKPVNQQLAEQVDHSIWKKHAAEIRRTRGGKPISQVQQLLWRPVVEAAAAALQSVGQHVAAVDVQRWFNEFVSCRMTAETVTGLMQRSVEVATHRRPPDAAWALGEAWRRLYAALVDAVSHGGLDEQGWREFRTFAVEMERIAFGPPAENLARILALIDSGVVDLRFLQGSTLATCSDGLVLRNSSQQTAIDKLIHAVIPAPGATAAGGPLASLEQQGVLRRLHRGCGFAVDEAGTPLGGAAKNADGLALLGRATEGCILGNDTLSRKLHQHDRLWAEAFVQRLQQADIYS